MKKLVLPAMALLAVLACFHSSFAKTYYRTYEIIEITGEVIVLEDLDGERLVVDKDARGYLVGDMVRYDKVRNVLRKSPWQPAKVIGMTDRSVTLQLNNGEVTEINMRSSYRNQFAEGDRVHYKASSGQIKKSNLKPQE